MRTFIFLLGILMLLTGFGMFVFESNAQNVPVIENRSGCCSHHGGVCGCFKGRAQCCDGTLSPSCGCD
ncbi:MAG: hypothetical protein PHX18_02930 [Candidatus Gastranaerophilales bacterium]|nr:hypothetical protein [Candidatus Gastranaerophilales bacterium]